MLTALLELKQTGNLTFENLVSQKNFRHSLFGGQVIAQALVAASKTVNNRQPHSLHAYFLKPGTSQTPVTYKVSIVRDGQSVSNRSVEAKQNGKAIFSMMCSFHNATPGFAHQMVTPLNTGAAPTASTTPTDQALSLNNNPNECTDFTPIDYMAYNDILFNNTAQNHANAQFWLKSKTPLSTPIEHYAGLTFASDIGLLATALLPHKATLFSGDVIPASMDHAIWFHQPPQFDHWSLYETQSPWAGGGRGYCQGHFYNANGNLIASVAQEGMIRPNSKASID